MTTVSKFYLPQLDGLRFLAFLLVFIHHYPSAGALFNPSSIPYWLAEKFHLFGWIGVDIFLCLSSFLLTSLLIMEHRRTGSLSIKQFFIRRALRIWPLYYLIIFLAFAVFPFLKFLTPAFHTEAYHLALQHHLFPLTIFLGNFSYAYFTQSLTLPIAPLWTVSLEEQFYIFWPIFLFILLPRNKKWFFIALGGLVLLSVGVRYYILANAIPYPTIWVFSLGRLDPFALGALVSYIYLNPKFKPRPFLALCLALALFGLLMRSSGFGVNNSAWHLLVADLAGSLLIYAAVYSQRFGKMLALKPLPWLGKISFGLYIFHDMVISALHGQALANWHMQSIYTWLIAFTLTFLITVLCATFSYYGFEKHFLKLKTRYTVIASRPA